MNKNLSIYLHFASIVEDTKWESDFYIFLNSVLKQVTGLSSNVFCNIPIKGTTTVYPDKSDNYGTCDVLVVVFNNKDSKPSSGEYTLINKIITKFDKNKPSSIFITQRYNSKGTDLPVELHKYPLYALFELNPKTYEINDFKHELSGGNNNQYLLKLTDLAYDIKNLTDRTDINNIESLRNRTIYLAEVSADQHKNRDRLRRALMSSGYYILPTRSLVHSKNYEEEVKACLDNSIMSINILGELYGDCPAGSDYSFQELQNRFFNETWLYQQKNLKQEPVIKRIIWVPPQLEPFEEKQIQYLKRINREINNAEDSELVQSTLSDLKILIDQNIRAIVDPMASGHEWDQDEILIIADDYNDLNTNKVRETFIKKNVKFRFLNTIMHDKPFKQKELMDIIGKFYNYVVINTKSDVMWISGILSLVARSKGYEGSKINGTVGLFLHNSKVGIENITILSIDPIVYTSNDLGEKLESFISKVSV